MNVVMKLSLSEIARIEALLTAREEGFGTKEIGIRFGLGDHPQAAASTTFVALHRLGIRVPAPARKGRPIGTKNKPFKAGRCIVSAEQWQERLSAAGF